MTDPRYSISILALNKIELTKLCIQSVIKHSRNYELILTDNGCTDGTSEYFDSLCDDWKAGTIPGLLGVTVVHNPENNGFVDPNRHALGLAAGEFFILLNNDAEVPSGWLEMLERPFRIHPKAALSGPAGGGCTLLPDLRGFPGKMFEYLEGSCLMCKTSLVRKHGLFAPYINFAYGEDSDLSLRMRELGHTIHRASLTIRHQGSATSNGIPGIREIEKQNHERMRHRWSHYLKVRKMDYPIILNRSAALGDVLLVSAVARTISIQKPACRVCVQTRFPDLFFNNPHVTYANRQPPSHDPSALRIDLDMAYESRPGMHIVDAYHEACGIVASERITRLHPSQNEIHWAFGQIASPGIGWCAVAPGPTTWLGKNWPEDRWIEVVRFLRASGMKVVLVGGDSPYEQIESDLDLRGQTSFLKLGALLHCCRFFVGLDSFPIHAAQAVGCPVIGLFGATRAKYILTDGSPWGAVESSDSIPCSGERHRVSDSTHVECAGACMDSIQAEEVISAIHESVL